MATPAVPFILMALWEPLLLALYWWQYRNPQCQLYTDIVMGTPAVSYTDGIMGTPIVSFIMTLWEPFADGNILEPKLSATDYIT